MIIINRYTCPIKNKVSIKAFQLNNDLSIINEYPKMITDNFDLFKSIDSKIIVCDVVRAAMLNNINIIK